MSIKDKFYEALSGGYGAFTASYVFDRLSAHGLLRTELDDRAREACKEYAKRWGNGDEVVLSVARDILAAEKPVERWTMLCPDKGCALFVYDNGANTGKSFPHDAEPEARAYVARKNKEGK